MGCQLCAARRQALSPMMVAGDHTSLGALPDAAVQAIHRIRTDAGRLGERWFRATIDGGLSEDQYVEIVSLVATMAAIDGFDFAVGLPERTLPTPLPGAPSRRRPRRAKPGPAWVSVLMPDDRMPDEPDQFLDHPGPRERGHAYIHLTISLVPDSAIQFWSLQEAMYQRGPMMRDFARDYRAISHAQIELVAARVAALNQCLY